MRKILSVLIVEDEPIVALGLAAAVEAAGGRVVGPVASTADALDLLSQTTIDAAIIDVLLEDRDSTPVALALIERDLPFVVHSGTGLPPELADIRPALPVMMKPMGAKIVIDQLLQQVPADIA